MTVPTFKLKVTLKLEYKHDWLVKMQDANLVIYTFTRLG